MLAPGFQVHLHEKILSGRAAIGRFDGQNCSLAFATTAGKVLVYNPHDSSIAAGRQPRLNINKQITALAAGALLPNNPRDVLLVGTPNFLQCYDVDQNRDVFFKDVPDGVNCMVVGSCSPHTSNLVVVGGNCSIQGFDASGSEVFWTVTGGNVSALALADIDSDGQNELLVGSDDADIRVYKDADVIMQIAEADVVASLTGLAGRRFAYALRNGTIGVYEGTTRLWRVKSKHSISFITAFDLDGDSIPEVVSGWSNGKVEARHSSSGDACARDNLGSGVAALLTGQLRNAQGELELLAASTDGEVRGYVAQQRDRIAETYGVSMQQQVLVYLAQKKQELIYELSSYQGGSGSSSAPSSSIAAVIPPDTRVDSTISVNKATMACELTLHTNNDTVIKLAIIFGEQVFAGESLLLRPAQPSSSLTIPIATARDTPVMLLMKVLVGSRRSGVYHVFELELELPKYAMYAAVGRPSAGQSPASYVVFTLQHPLSRLAAWIEARFSSKAPASAAAGSSLEAHFISLRTKQPLAMRATAGAGGLKVWLHTESMELAGELLQDLASYLGVDELSSTASFPVLMDNFKATLDRVEACSATRSQVEGDTAASCAAIKALVVRAEDARLLGDMAALRRRHRQLADLNRDMWVDHSRRASIQQELLQGLKSVNRMIQQAAKLRVGSAQAKVVAACRAAIKANNLQALNRVACEGETAFVA